MSTKMHFDTVHVTFSWDLEVDGSYERVDEQVLGDQWDTYRSAILNPENVNGALAISGDGGEALVQDELWHIMSELCFAIPPLLSNGVSGTFKYLSWPGEVRLSVEGSLVRVSGGDVPDFTVPMKELVRGLVECGQRYQALIGRVKDDPSTYSGLWEMLSGLAPEANEALTRASQT